VQVRILSWANSATRTKVQQQNREQNAMIILKRLAAMLVLATFFGPSSAQADSITFKMRSFNKSVINVKFFSPSRKVNWPEGKVFVLNDMKPRDMTLTCVAGEQICYGAATENKSAQWGVGIDGKGTCTSCCYRCNNKATSIIDINQN
jgi:hypothetical protein